MPATLSPTRRALAALVLVTAGAVRADERGELDSPMYRDPDIRVARVVKTFPKGLAELWTAALEGAEQDARARAALAIAEAHQAGLQGLSATAPALIRALERPDEHPAVLAAAARALIVLDARAAAPVLLKLARAAAPDLRDVAELALARWDHKPARDVWLDRVRSGSPPPRALLLAISCLGTVREERAADRLRELALAPAVAPPVRLAAARAAGEIRRSGFEADAKPLAPATGEQTNRLVAVALLRHHGGAEAIALLQTLARDPDPAVAVTAAERLGELGPEHILPVLPAVMASEGAEVRGHGVRAMIRKPSDEFVRALARSLSDPHPDVRGAARRGLRDLAGARRALVIEEASRVLAARDWRGLEQAAILLGQLDHKPAAPRLVELLATNRSEVATAVGWALRKLAVADTFPKVLEHLKKKHAALLKNGPAAGQPGVSAEALDVQMSQLVQLLGAANYRQADDALRALVPRLLRPGLPPVFAPVGVETRAAAIWALGLFNEGKPAGALVELIESRLTGDAMLGHDHPHVRSMAAVALARLDAKQSLEALRDHSDGANPSTDRATNACRWAINRFTGEAIPEPGTVERVQRNWFLVPVREP